MAEGIELITAHTGAAHVSVDDKQALYMGIFGDHGQDATRPLRLWQPMLDGATVTGTNSVTIPPSLWAYHGWLVRITTPVSLTIPTGSAGQTTTSYVNVRIIDSGGSQRAEISCDSTINDRTGGGYPSGFTPWTLVRNGLDAPTVTPAYTQAQPITAVTSFASTLWKPPYVASSETIRLDRIGRLVVVNGAVNSQISGNLNMAAANERLPMGYRPNDYAYISAQNATFIIGYSPVDHSLNLRGKTEGKRLIYTGAWVTDDPMPSA